MKTILPLFTKYKYLILVIIFSLLSVVDLANYGIPPSHDGEYHVMRFWQFYKELSEGIIYPRWAPDFNNGFGIPLFNYVYPLPNYIASFFHFLGFGFIDSFKLTLASASVVGAVFFYFWTKRFWGELGGLVSSVFYTFSPYHLLDVYVRGSVGEVWSLALAPALLWAYTEFVYTTRNKYFVWSSIFLALLIYAHNILALVFFGFFIFYAAFLLITNKPKKGLGSLLVITISGLGLSAPFWLPALAETKYVRGLQVFNPLEHFPQLHKLIYSSWGYGFSGSNMPDQMSFQIGVVNLLIVLLIVLILMFFKNKKSDKEKINKKILLFFLVLFFLSTFLITPLSAFIWKNLPLISYVQFPWRLLSIVILEISFMAGAIVLISKSPKVRIIIASILIIGSIGYSIQYAKAPFFHKRADLHYLTRSNFTDGTNSVGNVFNTVWMNEIPAKRKDKINLLDGKAFLSNQNLSSNYYKFRVEAEELSELVIHTAYFPSWRAEINGKTTTIKRVEGRMVIDVPVGINIVKIWLGNTGIQKLSYVIFLMSILILVFYVGLNRDKEAKVYKVHKLKRLK